MDAIKKAAEPAFIKQIAEHLKSEHQEAVAGLEDAELERRIEIGLARARKRGLTQQNTLTIFVAWMFEIAPNFDSSPAIHRILADTSVPPDERTDILAQEITPEEWLEAQRNADPAVWKASTP